MNHVVALSGGKDSTAMALRLAEVEPRRYTYVCTPTGDEPPELFAHWRHPGDLLGSSILPINFRESLDGLIREQGALPNWRQRWCTRMLKIEPYAAWLKQHAPAVSYVGLRADEPARAGGDYAAIPGIESRFPLREWGWGIEEVLAYLDDRGVVVPRRTDCQKCFFQALPDWFVLWRDNPAVWAEAEELEALTGHTFRSPGRDTWPASLAELRSAFERGRVPRHAGQEVLPLMQCRVCRL